MRTLVILAMAIIALAGQEPDLSTVSFLGVGDPNGTKGDITIVQLVEQTGSTEKAKTDVTLRHLDYVVIDGVRYRVFVSKTDPDKLDDRISIKKYSSDQTKRAIYIDGFFTGFMRSYQARKNQFIPQAIETEGKENPWVDGYNDGKGVLHLFR